MKLTKENDMGLCDFYVKDKTDGRIHKVGTDRHDSIWVDSEGTLHYQNLQNGDGCQREYLMPIPEERTRARNRRGTDKAYKRGDMI